MIQLGRVLYPARWGSINDNNDNSIDNNERVDSGYLEYSTTGEQVIGEQTCFQCHIREEWMKTK